METETRHFQYDSMFWVVPVPKTSRQQRVGWSDKNFAKGILMLSNDMDAMMLKI